MEYGALVSVVMPVFNRAHLIQRVVGGITAQSYRNLDIVIVDDCSTDDIEGAVAALGDDRVRLVKREKNGGVAAARNTGVEAARGEWIAFHDSDDYCVQDRIEQSVRALEGKSEEWIGVYGARLFYIEVPEGDYAKIGADIIPSGREPVLSGDLSRRTLMGNMINFPTLLVRKSALLQAGPSDPLLRKNVDWDLCLRLTRVGKIAFVPEPLILTPTPLDPVKSAQRVSRSVRQGARSLARITGKLRRIDPKEPALIVHYAAAARFLMRSGRYGFARKFLRASIGMKPMQPLLWAHFAASFAPGLHARLRRPDKI